MTEQAITHGSDKRDWPRALEQWGEQFAPHLRVFGPATIAVAALCMLWWSWGTWPDVIVDFGRELYVPWRLTEGDVLYRDLAYYNGPLSPYWNSLVFRLFGTSLRALAVTNFALLALTLAACYSLLSTIGSRASATLACLTFVLAFGFSRYLPAGNYNFICPYSHELTHGLLLSLGALLFVGRYTRSGRLASVAACGLCVGLALLTKPEVFLAICPACVVGLALAAASRKPPTTRLPVMAAIFVGAGMIPLVIALAALSLTMSPSDALASMLAAYRWLLAPQIAASQFYQNSMGVRNPGTHVGWLLAASLWYALFLGLPPLIAYIDWAPRRIRISVALAAVAVLSARLWQIHQQIPINDIARPVPIVIVAALVSAVTLWFRRQDAAARQALVLPIALLIFALLLLAKIMLFTRVVHYGFCLALPATLLAIVVLWSWLPPLLERVGSSALVMRAALLASLVVVVANFLEIAGEAFASQTTIVGQGGDAFRAANRGPEVNRLLGEIAGHVPEDATLAVVPEGCMLNYLARRRNSTRYVSLMPVEMSIFGEEQILAAFRDSPPDFVLTTNEGLDDYGFGNFGDGYADDLAAWITENYEGIGPEIPEESRSLHGQLARRRTAAKRTTHDRE